MLNCLFAATCLVLGEVQTPETERLDSKVRELVRQLDDDKLKRREEAERELIALGPAALDHLPIVSRRMSAEVKSRLTRVRSRFEREAVMATTRPSTVTLQGTTSLSEALAALKNQTGNRLVDYRERFGQNQSDPQLTFDFDGADYWGVVDHLLDKAQLRLYAYSGEPHTLAFVGRDPGQLPAGGRVSYGGPFRFEATRVEAVRDLRIPASESMRLSLEIAWEPRIQPIALTMSLDSITAVDENGSPILADSRQSMLQAPVQATVGAVEMDIPFKLPGRNVRKIASLRGTIHAVLPGREVAYQFDDLRNATNVVRRNAGVTVVLETLRKNADVYDLRIRVRFDNALSALESHRGWIYNNEAYLIDNKRNRVDHAGFETTAQLKNEVGLSYKFVIEKNLKDYSFVYKTPAAITNVSADFELRDIELP